MLLSALGFDFDGEYTILELGYLAAKWRDWSFAYATCPARAHPRMPSTCPRILASSHPLALRPSTRHHCTCRTPLFSGATQLRQRLHGGGVLGLPGGLPPPARAHAAAAAAAAVAAEGARSADLSRLALRLLLLRVRGAMLPTPVSPVVHDPPPRLFPYPLPRPQSPSTPTTHTHTRPPPSITTHTTSAPNRSSSQPPASR